MQSRTGSLLDPQPKSPFPGLSPVYDASVDGASAKTPNGRRPRFHNLGGLSVNFSVNQSDNPIEVAKSASGGPSYSQVKACPPSTGVLKGAAAPRGRSVHRSSPPRRWVPDIVPEGYQGEDDPMSLSSRPDMRPPMIVVSGAPSRDLGSWSPVSGPNAPLDPREIENVSPRKPLSPSPISPSTKGRFLRLPDNDPFAKYERRLHNAADKGQPKPLPISPSNSHGSIAATAFPLPASWNGVGAVPPNGAEEGLSESSSPRGSSSDDDRNERGKSSRALQGKRSVLNILESGPSTGSKTINSLTSEGSSGSSSPYSSPETGRAQHGRLSPLDIQDKRYELRLHHVSESLNDYLHNTPSPLASRVHSSQSTFTPIPKSKLRLPELPKSPTISSADERTIPKAPRPDGTRRPQARVRIGQRAPQQLDPMENRRVLCLPFEQVAALRSSLASQQPLSERKQRSVSIERQSSLPTVAAEEPLPNGNYELVSSGVPSFSRSTARFSNHSRDNTLEVSLRVPSAGALWETELPT